jgi:hypothetical protein
MQAGKNTVKEFMIRQIEQEGSTTTLDVKVDLREEGYWVDQHEVSQYMREIAEESTDVEFLSEPSDDGKYLIYTIFQYNRVPDPSQTVVASAKPKKKAKVYDPPIEWAVTATNIPVVTTILAESRNKARMEFVKRTSGVNYLDTRARKFWG